MNAFKVNIKNEYGMERIYPACADSQRFARHLMGKKTFSREDIKLLKEYGFNFENMTPKTL
jgi:hypothetical protein|tara:strand:+ start:428 stop:610 length:183 start_codon:yes stop_codon:yes gene_type:complete